MATNAKMLAVGVENDAPPEQKHKSEVMQAPVRPLKHRWYPGVKEKLEQLAALILLVPVAPLIGLFAILVKLTSRGPAFYWQTRIGKQGKAFTIYKLRTMIHNCESLTGARWSMPGDPRITWIGHLLRVTHLDELPQLLNVLKGDMGLIGPRPERPEFLPELEAALGGYRQRLQVRPGVTGLAQVQLPSDTSITSVKEKLSYDLYYVQHLSPWLDLKILFCTLLYVCGAPYRTMRHVLGIPPKAEIEKQMEHYVFEVSTQRQSGRAA